MKNINLRVRADGTVYVSAHKSVSQQRIEEFLYEKAGFILRAQEQCRNRKRQTVTPYCSETEICEVIRAFCREAYPYFAARGVSYPQIKFRKMTSRWGSCMPAKGVLTFNTGLRYAPPECVRYVVLHEFTHFLQANHSKQFYAELERVCPNHKKYRKMLNGISCEKE